MKACLFVLLLACIFSAGSQISAADTPSYVLAREKQIVRLGYENIIGWDTAGKVLLDLKGNGYQVAIPVLAYWNKKFDIVSHNYPAGFGNWNEMYYGDWPAISYMNCREWRIVHNYGQYVMHRVIRRGAVWPDLTMPMFYAEQARQHGDIHATWLVMAERYNFLYE